MPEVVDVVEGPIGRFVVVRDKGDPNWWRRDEYFIKFKNEQITRATESKQDALDMADDFANGEIPLTHPCKNCESDVPLMQEFCNSECRNQYWEEHHYE